MSDVGGICCSEFSKTFVESIVAANSATTLSALNEAIKGAMSGLGFGLFACVRIVDLAGRPNVHLQFGEGLEPWRHHYVSMGYCNDDGILGECLRRDDPFYWHELTRDVALTPKALRILSDARTHGLDDGFVVPAHLPNGSTFAVLLAGKCSRGCNPSTRAASELAAITYRRTGLRVMSAHSCVARSPNALTMRQRECLKWVRWGKSSTEIASIIGISAGVVDEHIAGACRRLGVHTRAQAILAAASSGEFDG
jgi:DNA-binding CsgD family transcriptional regulator